MFLGVTLLLKVGLFIISFAMQKDAIAIPNAYLVLELKQLKSF